MTRRGKWSVGTIAVALVVIVVIVALAAHRRRESPRFDLARAALSHPDFTWDAVSADGFTLYVTPGSFAAARVNDYRTQIAAAIPHALGILGEKHFPAHMRVFVVSSRADVGKLVGTDYNGWSDPPSNSFLIVARDECRPVFRHETMHLVSLRLWGQPLGRDGDPDIDPATPAFAAGGWLREGIAAAAEDLYMRYSYRGMAAQWQAEGGLLPIDSLTRAFYRQEDLAAYVQAGTLVEYLRERYGVEPLRRVWRDGASAFEPVYGKNAAALELEWQQWLVATPAEERPKSVAAARAEDRCPAPRK